MTTQHNAKLNTELQTTQKNVQRAQKRLDELKTQKLDTEAKLKEKSDLEAQLKSENESLKQQLQAKLDKQERDRQLAASLSQPATVYRVAGNGSLSDWLYKLRTCESGGNYAINTGNGFYGAYQFMDSTWDSWNTGYERADLAPPEVQDATIVKNTLASGGGLATQNPGCMAKMGLSAFPPAN